MKKRIFIGIAIVVVVVGALAGVKGLQIKKLVDSSKTFVAPRETVSSVLVREDNWQNTLTAIGSIAAAQGVTITPEIAGTVREIAFESGALVEKGQVLVRLDTAVEEAQLRSIEAQLELARINLARIQKLLADNTVSQAELDTARSNADQAQANAEALRVTIQKKTVRAPFAGRLGIRLVNLGEYIDVGKGIVSLQSPSPVYADFSLPQQELARLKTGMPVRLTTDSYPGREFMGQLTAIHPALNQNTRSVPLQATLDNADHALRPGMFARIQVILPEEQKVLTIPATAVLSAPYGESVYIIESKTSTNQAAPQLVVRQQFIKTGRTRGDFISVGSGLKAGEKIVSAGLFKLRNGMAVVEDNTLSPAATQAPKPADS